MSLARDLAITIGDVLRFSSDLMRYRFHAETEILKHRASRLMVGMVFYTAGAVLAVIGLVFMLIGVFVLLSDALESAGAAGLILGFVILLIAIVVALVGRTRMSRV